MKGREHPARRGRSSRPKNPGAGLRFAAGSRHALRGSEGPAGASAPCLPTSTETPTERASVIRRDGKGVNRGNERVLDRRRAVALARHYRQFEGLSIRQIGIAGSLALNDQGVLLRPDRGEGAGGQGPLRRGVSRLRCIHAAAQRQGRHVCVLQGAVTGGDERRWTRKASSSRCASGATATDGSHVYTSWSGTHAAGAGSQALERLPKR